MSRADILEPTGTPAVPAGDEPLYEVVNGVRVETPPMGVPANWIATRLSRHLGNHTEAQCPGHVIVETLFILDRERNLRRRPDLAFVSAERWPLDRVIPEAPAWDVVPDLAVEVVSPTDLFLEVAGKVREYFTAGVRLVWVILPAERQVYAYTAPNRVEILDAGSALEGVDVLPGFRVQLAGLFPPMAAASGG